LLGGNFKYQLFKFIARQTVIEQRIKFNFGGRIKTFNPLRRALDQPVNEPPFQIHPSGANLEFVKQPDKHTKTLAR
jgi:hypothetical protein